MILRGVAWWVTQEAAVTVRRCLPGECFIAGRPGRWRSAPWRPSRRQCLKSVIPFLSDSRRMEW